MSDIVLPDHAEWPAHTCTTFGLLRIRGACVKGYDLLARYIRDRYSVLPDGYGMDRPIPLAVVLASNGVADALWCLRATIKPDDRMARLLAADLAERALPIYERRYPGDRRPRAAVEAARDYARGLIGLDALRQARRDAAAAAYAANAAYAAAAAAADAAAAYAAAYAAAAAAADAAAAYAAADAAAAYAYAAAAYPARINEKKWQSARLLVVLMAERAAVSEAA